MNDRQTDSVSLAAGLMTIVVGVALLLDQSSDVTLSGGVIAALFAGVFGLVLLLSGLLDKP